MAGPTPRPPTVVTHIAGKAFSAEVDGFRIVTDQPVRAGGTATGPTPLRLLGASLGSCIALYVQQYCESRKLPYKGMRVEIEQTDAQDPHRVGEFVVKVILPEELSGHHMAMLARVAQSCPAHATLVQGATVGIELTAGLGHCERQASATAEAASSI